MQTLQEHTHLNLELATIIIIDYKVVFFFFISIGMTFQTIKALSILKYVISQFQKCPLSINH